MDTKDLKNFHYISLSEKGPVRQRNEDYVGYFDTINGHVFVVCDGIGGLPCGNLASMVAVNSFKFFFTNFFYHDLKKGIKDSFDYAHKCFITQMKENQECFGMGTTVVVAVVRDNLVYYGHVGDSRLYICRQNELFQLTRDHSYVNELLDRGEIDEFEAQTHPRKNEITRALTLKKAEIEICNSPFKVRNKDIMMLCSDGLYNPIGFEALKECLSSRTFIENKADALIKLAIANGGSDNITIQLIKFYSFSNSYDLLVENENKFSKIISFIKQHYRFIAVILVILISSIMCFSLFSGQNNNNLPESVKEFAAPEEFYTFEYNHDEDLDSLANAFNVSFERITLYNIAGKEYIKIPVQKIHTITLDDDINLLSLSYQIDKESIIRVNKLKSDTLVLGTQILIPCKKIQ